MAEEAQTRIGLDSSALRERLRPLAARPPVTYVPRAPGKIDSLSDRPHAYFSDDLAALVPVWATPKPENRRSTLSASTETDDAAATLPEFAEPLAANAPAALPIIKPQPFTEPALPRLQPSRVLRRQLGLDRPRPRKGSKEQSPYRARRFFKLPQTKLQAVLVGMAVVVFGLGLLVDIQTMQTNHNAGAQVSALAKQSDNGSGSGSASVPSTTKPSAQAVRNYVVAPNYPRYIMIPKLGVDARVTQVGVTASGALGTPDNVYDTAWYTGSAEPGQPGAMLIDGHVSSWTAHGVFYGLHTLKAGDKIQVERGDGTIFNYQVVKTVIYPSGSVNMQAAMTPITPGTPGLNLITCTGQVIKGTSLFNERVIVFAEQI